MLVVTERWERIFEREARGNLEACLPDVLKSRRWFSGKARAIQSVRIVESVPIPARSSAGVLLFILVEYVDGAREMYTFPSRRSLMSRLLRFSKTCLVPL
jgi:hypothetical protein